MKLRNAARYFDTCPVYDGYTGALLFNAQASTFMEAAAEGSVSVRRTLSLDPSYNLPQHSVISVLGERYVTGEENLDEWSSTSIRKACWTKKVSDYFTVSSPSAYLSGSASLNFYGQKKQVKEVSTLESSNLENVWESAFSRSATISKGQILKSGNSLYRVRLTYVSVDGFLTCVLDQLEYDILPVSSYANNIYDPVSDTYSGQTLTVNALPVDYKIVFDTQTQADLQAAQGDICLLVPQALNPRTGLNLTVAGTKLNGDWRVLNAFTELDAWNIHVRRV